MLREQDKLIGEMLREQDRLIGEMIREQDKLIGEMLREQDRLIGEMLREQDKVITNYVQKYATAQVHPDPYVRQMYKFRRTRIFAGFSKSVTAELLPPKPLG